MRENRRGSQSGRIFPRPKARVGPPVIYTPPEFGISYRLFYFLLRRFVFPDFSSQPSGYFSWSCKLSSSWPPFFLPTPSFFLFPSRAHTSLSAQLVVLTCRSAKSAVNFLQHAEFPLENAVTLNGGVLARGNTIFPCLRYFPTIPPPLNIPPPFLQRSITRNGMELATEKKKQKFLPFSSPTRKEQRYHLLSSESQREKKRRKKGRKYRWLVRSIREKIRADRCARVIINTRVRVKLINRANTKNGTRMRNEGMKYVCSLLPSPRGSTHGTKRRRQSWRRCFAMPSVG